MSSNRVTIMVPDKLQDRVQDHVKARPAGYSNLSDFYSKAILNQLERDGDFEARDLVESEEE